MWFCGFFFESFLFGYFRIFIVLVCFWFDVVFIVLFVCGLGVILNYFMFFFYIVCLRRWVGSVFGVLWMGIGLEVGRGVWGFI